MTLGEHLHVTSTFSACFVSTITRIRAPGSWLSVALCLNSPSCLILTFFFFNDTATPEISPLPLPDALPIPRQHHERPAAPDGPLHAVAHRGTQGPGVGRVPAPPAPPAPEALPASARGGVGGAGGAGTRSEEHTSELQSRLHLVCRLLLEKKK